MKKIVNGKNNKLNHSKSKKKTGKMQKAQNNVFTKISNKIKHFGDHSNLHGVGNVLSMSQIPGYKKLFWLSVLTMSGFGTFTILSSVLGLYTQSSVSYSVDTNYLSFDTPFPAVTLCEQLESNRLTSFIMAKHFPLTMTNFFKEVFTYNVKYCRSCTNCKMNSTCLENFLELVEEFRVKCEDMLTDCWWGETPFKCCERFHPIQTEYGICYAFNSRLANNESLLYVNRQLGLRKLVFTAIRSVGIRVHSPDEQITTKVKNILKQNQLPLVSELTATVKAEATTSDISIKYLGLDRRDCLFEHERPAFAQLWPFERYSYSACVLYCRAMMQVDTCNCTYHFMVKLNGIDICDIQGLACLYRNKDTLQENYDCGCLDACEEVYYEAVHVSSLRHRNPDPELTARGSKGVVQLNGLPTLRVRRHAFRDIFSFVVDIGGVGGVFFGASLLSVMEIVYLLCIRRGP